MSSFMLTKEIETLPYELRQEVVDFIDFLKTKHLKKQPLKEREFGFAKGKVKLHNDFDAPLDEFKEYM
jgi:Protein of unknown function (DUF2281)